MTNGTQPEAAPYASHCANNYDPMPVTLVRGEGVWLWDRHGARYLDMMSAYSAVSHGHGHPRLVQSLCEQAGRLAMTSRAFSNDRLEPFLARLCAVAGLDQALPMNTGAEAVETAIKAARRWGYRVKGIPEDKAEIIVAEGNFHGRTTTIVGFSSDPAYRAGFGPFAPGFRTVPFGDAGALAAAITPHTCAVLVEPIQGEGGLRVPPDGWLRELRSLCDRHRVLLLLDEIQSGLGRTGRMFAFEHEGIVPDGLMVGKALGGGLLPVSAFVARREVMAMFDPGSHGSTFGGNPLAAAVGLAALEVLEDECLVERSARLGAYMIDAVRTLRSPAIVDIRGRGLWVGVEIDPAFASGRAVCLGLLHRHVLTRETHETVIRLAPPLVVEEAQIDLAVDALRATLDDLERNRSRGASLV